MQIKNILKDGNNKKLLENFLSLLSLQGLIYILPFITVPYLVRVIGPEKFGLLGFSGATVGYFSMLISFGFSLSATRQIARAKKDNFKISKIFYSIITSQILFFIISLALLTVLIISFEKFQEFWFVYYIFLFNSFANIFMPIWFFQGVEKMKFITGLNIVSKCIFTGLIFLFVQEEQDFFLVPLFTLIGTLITAIIAMAIIHYKFKVRFLIPSFQNMYEQINESKHIFISTVAGSSYTISITFILGLMTNNTLVGYFSATDKIIKAIQGLIQPVITTLYPHINSLLETDEAKAIKFLKKTLYVLGVITLLGSLILLVFAKDIVFLLLGPQYIESVFLLQIMSAIPPLVGIGSVLGILTMISYGRSKELSQIYIKTAVLSLIATTFLISQYEALGASISVVFAEFIATLLMVRYVIKSNISIISFKY